MAISVKADTEDIPGIISLLGLGGNSSLPPIAPEPDASQTPPVDSSLGGADNPTAQPDTSNAPPPKNKLQTLREFLNPPPPDAPVPVPSPQVPGQFSDMPPADLAGSMAANTAHIKPTFKEAHPVLSTLLKVALNAGEGGLVGSQYDNAGQGFKAAQ
jgi:hypothetical protein